MKTNFRELDVFFHFVRRLMYCGGIVDGEERDGVVDRMCEYGMGDGYIAIYTLHATVHKPPVRGTFMWARQ